MPIARTIAISLLVVLLTAPALVFVFHAFSRGWFYPHPLPQDWTLDPWTQQLSNASTLAALRQSLLLATLVSLISLPIAYPAARVLTLAHIPGASLIRLFLFIPTIVPPVAMGMGLNILFLRIGLAGTWLGVILVHLIPIIPYTIFALTSVFARYDPTYEYQARVLGANRLRTFLSVTLPLLRPGLIVAFLFAFLISWSDYLLTLLIGGGRIMTLPLLLFSTAAGGNPTTLSVLALLSIAPPILIILATTRLLLIDMQEERES